MHQSTSPIPSISEQHSYLMRDSRMDLCNEYLFFRNAQEHNNLILNRNSSTIDITDSNKFSMSPEDLSLMSNTKEKLHDGKDNGSNSQIANIPFSISNILSDNFGEKRFRKDNDSHTSDNTYLFSNMACSETSTIEVDAVGLDINENSERVLEQEQDINDSKVENVLLHPYYLKNDKEFPNSLKVEINIRKRKYLYLKNIAEDNLFSYKRLVISVVRENIVKKCSRYDTAKIVNAYAEYFDIVSASYNIDDMEIKPGDVYKVLYKHFKNYELWVISQYKLVKSNEGEHFRRVFREQCRGFNQKANIKCEELFKLYVKIFDSNNYNILFRILPGLNLIKEHKEIKFKTKKVTIAVIYMQLIMSIFDVFRYECFDNKNTTSKNLQSLYTDKRFNETVLNMGIVLVRLLVLLRFKEIYYRELEILTFIYFIRSKFNAIYETCDFCKLIGQSSFYDKCVYEKKIVSKNGLINISFTKQIKRRYKYKKIRKIISKEKEIINSFKNKHLKRSKQKMK